MLKSDEKSPLSPLSLLDIVLTLFVLSAFAVAQPLFDVLSRTPEFFSIRRATRSEVLSLVFVVSVLIPALVTALVFLGQKLSRSLGAFLLGSSLALFAGLTVLSLFPKREALGSALPLVTAILVGTVAAVAAYRWKGVRTFFRYASPAIVIFPALFLANLPQTESASKTSTAKSGPTHGAATPVIVVVFDELPLFSLLNREGVIDGARLPGFQALASTSWWFRNATTLSAWTERALPIILTGKRPATDRKQLPTAEEHPQSLFTLLSASHEIRGFEQITSVCPTSLCGTGLKGSDASRLTSLMLDSGVIYLHLVTPASLANLLPSIATGWGNFLAPTVKTDRKGKVDKGVWSDDEWLFERFLDSLDSKGDRPGMHFVHLTFPHVPYRLLPSGKRYIEGRERDNDEGYVKQWGEDRWKPVVHYNRFLNQLSVADRMLSQILEKLREQEMFDRSLIIVLADHGLSFQNGEYSRRVSERNFSDVMRIPFFVKLPNQREGKISDHNVEIVDVVPTIVDTLGIEPSAPLDGESATRESDPRSEKIFYRLEQSDRAPFRIAGAFNGVTVPRVHEHALSALERGGSLEFIGPRADLQGQDESTLRAENGVPLEVSITASEEYNNVDIQGSYIPAFLRGRTSQRVQGALAIVVNGKVAARTLASPGKKGLSEFSALLPEKYFRAGKNEIRVYEVDARGFTP